MEGGGKGEIEHKPDGSGENLVDEELEEKVFYGGEGKDRFEVEVEIMEHGSG